MSNANEWITRLGLEQHPEGGWFKECYQAPSTYGTSDDGRVMGGTIYFLLAGEEISHLHVIDCEEIWYYHEGCGVRIYCLSEDGSVTYQDLGLGEGCQPMVVIPKGVIFGASNLNPDSYTLMSCATMPNFHYEGFRLVAKTELDGKYPADLIEKYTIR